MGIKIPDCVCWLRYHEAPINVAPGKQKNSSNPPLLFSRLRRPTKQINPCFALHFRKGSCQAFHLIQVHIKQLMGSSVTESSDHSTDLSQDAKTPSRCHLTIPKPPPLIRKSLKKELPKSSSVATYRKHLWDNLFKEGHGADVCIIASDGVHIPAHNNVLSVASPVLENSLKQARVTNGIRYLRIPRVYSEAICIFLRFLYSSCYEEEHIKEFVLHLLVLSHAYAVPALKRVCECILERGWLTIENVVDVLQLARNCDASRIALVCTRMIVKDFKCVYKTEAWKVMKHANPALEQELLELVVEADSRKQERVKKLEEKRVYLQLHEAMEALLHICRDGCKTIGPRDKALKASQSSCNFSACKGLESMIRHFSSCKTRVPGGCIHCKRMWQLLELHSRMCNEPDYCNVPLCRYFKVKMQKPMKKDEAKWRVLVSKVVAAKNAQRLLYCKKRSA